jgi:hypothetical protein
MKKEKKATGFWADVRELSQLIRLKVAQGHGTRSLQEAMKQQLRDGSVLAVDSKDLDEMKKQPGGMRDLLKSVPKGQQLRLTAAEYRELMKKK